MVATHFGPQSPVEDMVEQGAPAPDFTAPLANGDVTSFTLSSHLDAAPLVLAFFPGAFTGTCTTELETFQAQLDEYHAMGASLYGISVDTPWALNAFRDELGLSFGLISDSNRRIVDAYDVSTDFVSAGVDDVAQRAVFIVDRDGIVRYAWVANDPSIEPDYAEVRAASASLVEEVVPE